MTEITQDVQMSDPNDPHGDFKMEIKDGMFALINDRQVWHNATPMNKVDTNKPGYLDCFVLTS